MDLTGKLVRLRALEPSDAPTLVRNLSDPEVVQYLGGLWSRRPYAAADAEEFIQRRQPDLIDWAIECLQDGALIGATGLHEINQRDRNCYWGIALGPPERWGKGYGTETCRLVVEFAFRHLGMEKVYLHVYEGNERGRRAYAKAGFRIEGTLPRHVWLNGTLAGSHLMAVYRDDPLYA